MTTDDVRVLKSSTCPSLAGRTTLTYEIGANAASEILARVTKSSGTGPPGAKPKAARKS
jgi:hypothetical protein